MLVRVGERLLCRERHRRSFEVVIWVACVRLRAPLEMSSPNYFFLIPMGGVDPKRGDSSDVPFVYPCPPNLDSRAIQSSTGTA